MWRRSGRSPYRAVAATQERELSQLLATVRC
jgi:hypothetical protein